MPLATRPKKTIHIKKRSAQHHRHSKLYLKPYWPYLPMLLIVGVGLLVNSFWSHHAVLANSRDFSSDSLVSTVDMSRAAAQAGGLSLNAQLMSAAQAKADDMAKRNYWSHTSPDGQTSWQLLDHVGYPYQAAAETLAYGFDSADATINGWLSSPEHRAALLNPVYTEVGFGVAHPLNFQGHGPQTIVVAELAKPTSAVLGEQVTKATSPVLQSNAGPRQVARLQLLTGASTITTVVVSALTGAALTLFLINHGFRLKRALNQGEAFVVHHPYVDIGLVVLVTIGFLLTRTSGLIH